MFEVSSGLMELDERGWTFLIECQQKMFHHFTQRKTRIVAMHDYYCLSGPVRDRGGGDEDTKKRKRRCV